MDLNITTIKAAQRTSYIALIKNFAKCKYVSTTIPVAQADLAEHMSKMTDLAVRRGYINNDAYATVSLYVASLYVESEELTDEALATQILDDVEGLRVTMSNTVDQALVEKMGTLTQELADCRANLVASFTPAAKVAMERFNELCEGSNLGS